MSELLMRHSLRMFAPCIASAGILLIVNAVLSGTGLLVPTMVIVGAALTMAGIIILTAGKLKT